MTYLCINASVLAVFDGWQEQERKHSIRQPHYQESKLLLQGLFLIILALESKMW